MSYKLQRRVAGFHALRLDGISDLLLRCRDKSVFDIGCNRGLVGLEFAGNGAKVVHGCDIFVEGINTAREIFIDLREVESKFEVIDLSTGAKALRPFGDQRYDIIVLLATYHKLKRIMAPEIMTELILEFGRRTNSYFGWRGTSDKSEENEQEIKNLDRDLGLVGLKRIQTSYISKELGVAAIWEKK